jgi:predicted nucleic acid-binding protein
MTAPGVEIAADNDIVLKGVSYRLCSVFWPGYGVAMTVAVLGALRYVVGARLKRSRLGAAEAARTEFDAFLGAAHVLEPTADELQLAAEIEMAAQRAGLPVDSGESQLAAVVMERGIPVFETGDKRAVTSIEQLRGRVDALDRLDGRVRCLEQVVWRVIEDAEVFDRVASAICGEIAVDKTLAICFSCHSSGTATREKAFDGLLSYVEDLRSRAPNLLAA